MCLVIGSRHQGQTGDAGRKAQIVLDARRRTGLTARRTPIEREYREPFGSCIHRSGKTRRSSADDDRVLNLVWVDRFDEPDAAGELDIAGIAQQLPIGTENDRQFPSVDVKALDQRLCTRIGLWVQSLVRMRVAGEENFEAQNIGMICTADDHGSTGSEPEKGDAAEDQGAHDAFAELSLLHQEIAQPARRNEEGLDRLLGVGIDQGRAARKLCKFAMNEPGPCATMSSEWPGIPR